MGRRDEKLQNEEASDITKKQKENKRLASEETSKRLISERAPGEFHRTFSFAKPIKTSEVTATVHHGVVVSISKTRSSFLTTIRAS